MLRDIILTLPLLCLTGPANAADLYTVAPVQLTEWKAVFGKVEASDMVPARSRLGGTLTEILVSEGARVDEGALLATVTDAKLDLRLTAIDATQTSLQAQLENAQSELTRGESLVERGVATAQRLDALRTQVDVVKGQIAATRAERSVIEQQAVEGAVLAPIAGTVLSVPVTRGSVVMPGEPVAVIGGGGFFLRLAVPERHAAFLKEGAEIMIGNDGTDVSGQLAKVYPQIENGRVIADVKVSDLSEDFVDARVLVRLPVGETQGLVVPVEAVATRMGLDFVSVVGADGTAVDRVVVPGEHHALDGVDLVEILTGLSAGEQVLAQAKPTSGAATHE